MSQNRFKLLPSSLFNSDSRQAVDTDLSAGYRQWKMIQFQMLQSDFNRLAVLKLFAPPQLAASNGAVYG
jgi:hypothetical protein